MQNISAIILAGGKSSRMGQNKALMKINGITIIELILNEISKISTDILISSNTTEYNFLNFKIVNDEIKNIVPISGIYSGLKNIKNEKAIIVSCDIPFINNNLIEYLIENSQNFDVTIPEFNNFLEPLIGIYSKSIVKNIENEIINSNYSIQKIIKNLNYNILKINSNLNFYNENLFLNVNNFEDFEKAKKVKSEK